MIGDMQGAVVGQWGWCVWDEGRLVGRGLVDWGFEGMVGGLEGGGDGEGGDRDGGDREAFRKRICERREGIRRAHGECAGGMYGVLEREIEWRFGGEWWGREEGRRGEREREREREWVRERE